MIRSAEYGEEALPPAIDGAPVDPQPSFGQPLGDIGVAEAETHVPAHGERHDIVRDYVTGAAAPTMAGRPARPTPMPAITRRTMSPASGTKVKFSAS